MVIGMKTFSIQAFRFPFDLRNNAGFLLKHGGCIIITLTTCIGNLKIRNSAFHKEIYEDCQAFPGDKN